MARPAAPSLLSGNAARATRPTPQAIEAKKESVKSSKNCPYCEGTGSITCADCLGSTTRMTAGGEVLACKTCDARGVHTCENCKGRGRFIPSFLDKRASRDPESELEEIGLQ